MACSQVTLDIAQDLLSRSLSTRLISSGVKTLLRRTTFSKPVIDSKTQCYLLLLVRYCKGEPCNENTAFDSRYVYHTLRNFKSFAQDSPQWRLSDSGKAQSLTKDWLTLDYKSDISKFWNETKR